MRAVVMDKPGPPEVLEVRRVPRPAVRPGWTLVQVKAFGLNRSELMTRQGHSPGVHFPRVLGIECVGVIADPSDSGLPEGATVAAVMGEMGRAFDGGYAEYALLPNELLMPLTTTLDWARLAAIPETYLTAHGSLAALGNPTGGTLLIRGGTSSVGMATLSLARAAGLTTIATTRNPDKAALLTERGADHVVVDPGSPDGLADKVRAIVPDGPDVILELVGANLILDSLNLVAPGGTVCLSGLLGGVWVLPEFEPLAVMPSGRKLTVFQSEDLRGAAGACALQTIVDGVAAGTFHANLDTVFPMDAIVEAHRYMEGNRAAGKVVVLVDDEAALSSPDE
jgi:NADPH:quinone reductase-like Zn-dependent oxidoreductase